MFSSGSEHTLAGLHYPAELHLVHEGLTNPNKLAVIGVFFVLGDDDKALLQECTILNKIKDPGLLFNIIDNYLLVISLVEEEESIPLNFYELRENVARNLQRCIISNLLL